MIQLSNISKCYGDHVVLENVDLTIESGSVFGLIGPNGAGKSTLLKVMNGVMQSNTGSVLYDGVDVYENPDVKKDIFLISDDPFYFANACIYDMKKFYQVWYPSLNNEIYRKFLNIFKLDEKKPIREFSKGMKRQAFIILALAISPRYLFMDEAFDGLDPLMRLSFKRAINEFIEQNEMTIIISSHNLRELEDICDSYGILEHTSILTSGNVDESKCQMHKVQLAFDHEKSEDDFKAFDLMSIQIHSRVVNIVVKGKIDIIKNQLLEMKPIMLETLNVNLEEIFIYEMARKGYGVYDK